MQQRGWQGTVRRAVLALLLLAGAAACQEGRPVDAVLEVEGMTCRSCEQAITYQLERIEGVRAARASHMEQKVWITFVPSEVRMDTIVAAIRSLGYKVESPGAT